MVKNLACGIITLAFAIGYLIQAAALPTSALADPVGASGFPMLIGWTMVAASVLLLIRTLIGMGRRERPAVNGEEDADDSEIWAAPGHATARAAGLVVIAAFFLLILPVAGYVVSLFLMIAAVALYQGQPLTWRLGLIAAGGAICLWVLFALTLNLPLPAGIWADFL